MSAVSLSDFQFSFDAGPVRCVEPAEQVLRRRGDGDRALRGRQAKPAQLGKVTFELRVFPRRAGQRVVVGDVEHVQFRASEAVLVDAVRSLAEPAFGADEALRIIEGDAEIVECTGQRVSVLQFERAVGLDPPAQRIESSAPLQLDDVAVAVTLVGDGGVVRVERTGLFLFTSADEARAVSEGKVLFIAGNAE